jgi:hypothetical protein
MTSTEITKKAAQSVATTAILNFVLESEFRSVPYIEALLRQTAGRRSNLTRSENVREVTKYFSASTTYVNSRSRLRKT